MVSSCSATLLRSFSSLECFIHLSGTLAMKFWSRNTCKDFFLSDDMVNDRSAACRPTCSAEERDSSLLAKALTKLTLRVVYRYCSS